MYAAGDEHRLKAPSERVLRAVADRSLDGVTSTEVVQEILHRFTHIGMRKLGGTLAEATLDLFAPVLPITHETMSQVPALLRRHPGLSSRDLVHVATCASAGIGVIVSPDRGFDEIRELRRIDPADDQAVESLLEGNAR